MLVGTHKYLMINNNKKGGRTVVVNLLLALFQIFLTKSIVLRDFFYKMTFSVASKIS